jgi:uncharacterized protein (DUF1501 family)
MNRRYFLKQSAAIAPFVLAFNPFAVAQRRFLQSSIIGENYKNRKLVLIELNGGNDGLNTVIPIDKYNILSVARPNVLIPESKILRLDDTPVFGFHPALPGLQRLYNDKLVSIIQGVGYPNADFSHSHELSIKQTANTEAKNVSGWLGRYFDYQFPNYPDGYPVQSTDGPPSIRCGQVSFKITVGMRGDDLGIGINNISDFDGPSLMAADDLVADNSAGANINIIRATSRLLKLYAPVIQGYAKRQENLSKLYPEPGKNPLADQLKMVAKLIGSGLDTSMYVVHQSGYDTHAEQVEKNDSTQGIHANLLNDLSVAITAFEDDLYLMGKQDEVLGMTYSEFGRRIGAGESYGTDHGTADTVLLFGTKLKNGIIGQSPDIPLKVTRDDNLPVQFDFRTVYRSVLQGWFGIASEKARTIIGQGPDEKLDLFKTS